MPTLQLATFRADITPPIGHPLCGGSVKPVEAITDPQYALGIVLLNGDAPVVLCAVDWCGLCNEDHVLWRQKLAAAACTTPERVAVQCLHQHNAPYTDLATQRLISQQQGLSDIMDVEWFEEALDRVAQQLRRASDDAQPITHVAMGQARVDKVASNRRVLGPDGKVKGVRWSACRDQTLRDEPEGLIDPMLKTISFWDGDRKRAALHYYATHPMSYYGDGLVSSDFAGLARERRTAEDPGAMHVYFTGCGGNITAGKYNDGAPDKRPILMERMYRAMVESERQTERIALGRMEWRAKRVALPPRSDLNEPTLLRDLADPTRTEAERRSAAWKLCSLRRLSQSPMLLTCLHLNSRLCLLHLPGEPFVEYQLYAQQQRPGGFVAVAGYGDAAPGYIPLAKSSEEGGYEPTAALAAPEAEWALKSTIAELVKA